MFSRLVLALTTGPIYGFLATLAVVPVSIVLGVLVFLLTSAVQIDGSPGATIAAFFVLIVAGLFSVAINIIVTVQMARYAASFAGAKPIGQQPPFITAFWRGLVVMILFVVFSVLLGATVSVLMQSFWASLGLPQMTQTQIRIWLEGLAAYAEGTRSAGEASDALEYALLGVQFYLWISVTVLGMLLVPRVCGFGLDSARIWSARYLLFRFLVMIPCCAAVLAIFAEAIVFGLGLLAPEMPPVAWRMASATIQISFITGTVFAVEAMLLAAARDYGIERREALVELERMHPRNFRAMLDERMHDAE